MERARDLEMTARYGHNGDRSGGPLSSSLVGRDSESRGIDAFLERAFAGEGGVLLISGAAGIGKSRLLELTGDRATSRGGRALLVRCEEPDRGVPYGPWTSLLRSFLERSPRDLVYQKVTPFRTALQKLVPELEEKIWLYDAAPSDPGPLDRTRFLRAVAEFFTGLSEDRPLLLGFDDINWADVASVELLDSVARANAARPLAIAMAFRDTSLEERTALAAFLLGVRKERRTVEIRVPALQNRDIGRLAASVLGQPEVSPNFRDRLHARTQGNPFYAEEILHSLGSNPDPGGTSAPRARGFPDTVDLPATVDAAIRDQLDRLDDASLQLLRVASLLGESFDEDVLSEVGERDLDSVVGALERAERARIVRAADPRRASRGFEFAHPLIREVLLRQVSEVRARLLHLRTARVLESRPGPRGGGRSASLAHHYVLGGDRTKSLEFSVLAGDEAADAFARSESVVHFRNALQALEDRPEAATRSRVLDRMADQLVALGDAPAASISYREAAEGWIALGHKALAGDAFRKAAGCEAGPREEGYEFLRRAKELLASEIDGPSMVRWYGVHSAMLYEDGRVTEALSEARAGLDLAERLGTPAERANARLQVAFAVPVEARAECLELLTEASEIAVAHNLDELFAETLAQRAVFTIHCGEVLEGSLRYVDEGIAAARRVGSLEREMWWWTIGRPYGLIRMGRFAEALAGAVEGGRFRQESTGNPGVESLTYQGWIAVVQGRDHDAGTLIDQGLQLLEERGSWYWEVSLRLARSRLEIRRGGFDTAEAELARSQTIVAHAGATALMSFHTLDLLALRVRCAVRTREVRAATRFCGEMDRLAERMGTDLARAFVGQARAECGEIAPAPVDDEEGLLRESVSIWERLGWRHELAGALVRLGDVHRRGGNADRAGEAFRRSLGLFEEMTAAPEVDLVRARLRYLGR